jgi:Toprim domain-containing protein
MMDARALAYALGGNVVGRNRVTAPGPGHSARDRSLAVSLHPRAPDGFLVHSFAGDDWMTCRDYVRQRLGLPPWEPGDEQDRRVPPQHLRDFDRMSADSEADHRRALDKDDIDRITRAAKLFAEAQDPRGTVAESYLNSRALDLPDDLAGNVLRFHPRCPWRNENTGRTDRIPVLLAAFRSVDDNAITGVHRIRLDQPQRWPKTERRMLGIVHRAAVKLAPIANGTLAVGEGVETCMAAQQLDVKPAWALGSVGAITFFPIIESVRKLIVLRESGEASRKAANHCSDRWLRTGRRVQFAVSDIGSDANDALMAVSR